MTKRELSDLLHSVGIPVNEGIASEENQNKYPKIVYWPYIEEDINASGTAQKNKVTYQVSVFSRVPQCKEYKTLRKKLRDRGIRPVFYHQFIEEDPVYSRTWHTYFAIEVLEEIEE